MFLFGKHPAARENKLEAFCQCSVSHTATSSLTFFFSGNSREQCQSRLFTREKRTRSRLGISGERWAIGIYKNRIFQPMTNFHIACKDFVSNGSAVEGYLVDKIPAYCQCLDGVQANSERYVNSECT